MLQWLLFFLLACFSPWQTIIETGEAKRTTTHTYENLLDKWIIGLPKTTNTTVVRKDENNADVTDNLGTITHDYDPANGNLKTLNKYGVQTQYDYHPDGELKSIQNALGQTSVAEDYYRGVPRKVTNPLGQVISRVVNPDGTIKSETLKGAAPNGGDLTTAFEYDNMQRVTKITPPQGTASVISYPTPTRVSLVRGSYSEARLYDGFGRLRQTQEGTVAQGGTLYQTDYDTLGRKTKEYYPVLAGTTPSLGTSYTYDALGRVKTITHPANIAGGAAVIENADYLSPNTTQITNGNGHTWQYQYRSFGDPAKCLVPQSYGVLLGQLKETNLWEVYCMLMPRQRLESERKYKTLKRASLR